ncbi:MAG: hypothetical protein JWQ40_2636 [Segetibacter sp.]|nr:hypothetical protein [Segetibacter sp.]
MQFGNWKITEDSIAWDGNNFQRFVIPAKELNVTRQSVIGDSAFYEWILRATDEDWLTQNDLYDLNYAFVYAIARTDLEFNYEIFDATLEQQFLLFEEEEDDDLE